MSARAGLCGAIAIVLLYVLLRAMGNGQAYLALLSGGGVLIAVSLTTYFADRSEP